MFEVESWKSNDRSFVGISVKSACLSKFNTIETIETLNMKQKLNCKLIYITNFFMINWINV